MMALSAIRAVIDCWAEQFVELVRGQHQLRPDIRKSRLCDGCQQPSPALPDLVDGDHSEYSADRAKHASGAHQENGQMPALRLLPAREKRGDSNCHRERALPRDRSLLGHWPFETMFFRATRRIDRRIKFGRARRAERHSEAANHTLRQFIPNVFSVLDGISPAPDRWRQPSGMAFPRAFFSALLRSAAVRKFMVGFELLGMPQRDITPETSGRAPSRCAGLSPRLADDGLRAAILSTPEFSNVHGRIGNRPRHCWPDCDRRFVPLKPRDKGRFRRATQPLLIQPVVVGAHVRINQRPSGIISDTFLG